MKKVFLGGTCNNSKWRNKLIPMLKIDYFNPVVKDWNEECQAEEIKQRQECDFVLYVIAKEMKGFYSIAEVIDDSNKRPEKTVFCILPEGWDDAQWRSWVAVAKMVSRNGGKVCANLDEVARYLNKHSMHGIMNYI